MLALLLMQAEIARLEEELDITIRQDNFSNNGERQQYCNNWIKLKQSAPNGEQWQKVQALKNKLMEYS
jgi:hypothetical protein